MKHVKYTGKKSTTLTPGTTYQVEGERDGGHSKKSYHGPRIQVRNDKGVLNWYALSSFQVVKRRRGDASERWFTVGRTRYTTVAAAMEDNGLVPFVYEDGEKRYTALYWQASKALQRRGCWAPKDGGITIVKQTRKEPAEV